MKHPTMRDLVDKHVHKKRKYVYRDLLAEQQYGRRKDDLKKGGMNDNANME